MLASRKTRAMLNPDVFYNIVDMLEDEHERDALESMSRTCKLLGNICRGRLFKRVKVDIHDREGINFFHSILKRDPQLAWFIRHISITDNHPPSSPSTTAVSRYQRVHVGPTASLHADRYSQIIQDNSTLSRILRRLQNLSNIGLLLQYVFSTNDESPLHWSELSPTIRSLFQQQGLTTVRLEGVRCIPPSISKTFLSLEDLHLSRCTFTRSLAEADRLDQPNRPSTRPLMKRLSLEWIGMGEDMDADAECSTILGHWAYLDWSGFAHLPDITQLSLSLGCWSSIIEAGLFLNVFSRSVRALSLDTIGLQLEPLRLLPFYQAAVDRTIRPLSTLDSKSVLFLMSQGVTALADGWVDYDLHPLSLRHPCNPKVQTLDLSATYWTTSANCGQNGEMAWICNMLADLPDERARAINTLSIRIQIGRHHVPQDAAAALMMRFAEDDMWCLLNHTLAKDKWSGLRSLSITANAPPVTLHPNLHTLSTLVSDHIRDSCLYDLNKKGILQLQLQADM